MIDCLALPLTLALVVYGIHLFVYDVCAAEYRTQAEAVLEVLTILALIHKPALVFLTMLFSSLPVH